MGCVFVNPTGKTAGALIEACGLKGTRVGGAVVSEVHANFILNEGGTSADVASLIELVKNKNCIFVYNKVDLIKGKDDDKLYVSAINKDVEKLKEAIINKLGLSQENYDNPSIANTREIGILENIKEILEHVLIDVKAEIPLDLINSELKDAYLKTLSILGEDNDFDIAKEIFSRFCVGK